MEKKATGFRLDPDVFGVSAIPQSRSIE